AGSLLDQVNTLEPLMQGFRDDEFEALTAEIRRRIGVEHKPFPKKTAAPVTPPNGQIAAGEPAAPHNGQIAAREPPPPTAPPAAAAPTSTASAEPSEAFATVVAMMDQQPSAHPTLDELMPFAFAACREVGKRTKNMRHFDVQIVGGAVLHQGKIAEMVTGEG